MANKPLARYLRNGWTEFWLAACMLLIILWVRSYNRVEGFHVAITRSHDCGCGSVSGSLSCHEGRPANNETWGVYSAILDAGYVRPAELLGRIGIAVLRYPGGAEVVFPHLFTIAASLCLALTPWARKRWRYSLRTLLIFNTVVAVLLGVIVWACKH